MNQYFNSNETLNFITDVKVRGPAKFRADLEYDIMRLQSDDDISELVQRIKRHHEQEPTDTDPILRFIYRLAMYRPLKSQILGNLFELIQKETKVFPLSLPNISKVFEKESKIRNIKSVKNTVKLDDIDDFAEYATDPNSDVSAFYKTAVKYGSINIFRFLLNNGSDISLVDASRAILGGNYEIIRYFDEKEIDFSSSLMVAAECYRDDVVDWIIRRHDIPFRHFLLQYGNTTIKAFLFLRKKMVVFFPPSLSILTRTTDLLFYDILRSFKITVDKKGFLASSAALNYDVMIEMENVLGIKFNDLNIIKAATDVGEYKIIEHIIKDNEKYVQTVLNHALCINHLDLINLAIIYGANINADDAIDKIRETNLSIMKDLIDLGLNKDKLFKVALSDYRNSIVTSLALSGVDLERENIFKTFLQRNIEKDIIIKAIHSSTKVGENMLNAAILYSDEDVINEILKMGVKPSTKSFVYATSSNKSSVLNSEKMNYDDAFEVIDPYISVNTVQHLIIRGAKLKSVKPLIVLDEHNNRRVLDLLLDICENVAPSLYKAHKERDDIIEKFILHYGADDRVALRKAISFQNMYVIMYILLNGQFTDLSEELNLARKEGNQEIIELIKAFIT